MDFPRSIGSSRIENFELSFHDIFNRYKFIIFSIFLLTFLKFKKLGNKKLNFISDEFISFLLILIFTFTLIYHQIMTKNQIYIYFLIPIIFLLIDSELSHFKFKLKKYYSLGLILILSLQLLNTISVLMKLENFMSFKKLI